MTAKRKDFLPTSWYEENYSRPLADLAAERSCTVEAMWWRFRRHGIPHWQSWRTLEDRPAATMDEGAKVLYHRPFKPDRRGCEYCSREAFCMVVTNAPYFRPPPCENGLDLAEERAQLAGAERVG